MKSGNRIIATMTSSDNLFSTEIILESWDISIGFLLINAKTYMTLYLLEMKIAIHFRWVFKICSYFGLLVIRSFVFDFDIYVH